MFKVIGIGDNVVDKYLHIKTYFPGGNALNFAVYAKMFGINSAYMGVFGNDEPGNHIKSVLQEIGVDYSHSVTEEGENGFARVNLVDGDRVFLKGNGGGVSSKKPLKLYKRDLEYIKNFDIIHSSCYSSMEKEYYKLKDLNIFFSFDFSDSISDKYLKEICPYISFGLLSCSHLSLEETKEKLIKTRDYGCKYALASRGVEGATFFDGKRFYTKKANRVEPVDTLGAGDSFVTAFLCNLVQKEKSYCEEVVNESLEKGAEFAAKTCMVMGAFGYGKKY